MYDTGLEEDEYIIKDKKLSNPLIHIDMNNINDEVSDQEKIDMLAKESLCSNGEWVIGSDRKNIHELVKNWILNILFCDTNKVDD